MENNEDKTYCVYMHTNLFNQKCYIGVTKQTPERRWLNGYGYKPRNGRQSHFWSAICKYGWDNFAHEILCDCLSKEDAYQKEQEFIEKYDSTNPSKGYNISTGGEAPTHGCKHSEEAKRKIGDAQKGEKNHQFGKIPSELVRQKIQQSNPDKKSVLCVELNEVFVSILEASRRLNITASNISRVCRGLRETAGGYHFVFYELFEKNLK